jgi:serpin B
MINKNKILWLLIIIIALISLSFTFQTVAKSSVNKNSQIYSMNNKQNIDANLIESNRQFAFKLFKTLNTINGEDNLFISPTSVAIALTLLYNGADGITKEEMAKTLKIQGLSLAQINQNYRDLQQLLISQQELELSIANSLWIRQDFPIKQTFIDTNKKYFQAEVTELDFNKPEAKNIINNWVNNATGEKIPEIVDSIKPDDVLFLINAIYFQSNWQKEFDAKLTQNQPFFSANGKTIDYPLMSQTGDFNYHENQDFQLINLPYGESGKMSMYILLPQKEVNLTTIINKLNDEHWQEWRSQLIRKKGLISIPKFTLKYETKLNKTLENLGMKTAFNNYADFSQLTEEKVAVSEVKHKTFIKVDEKGTEAAAVTSIGIRATSMPVDSPFQMIVNRPFFYVIQDNETGVILFMGNINKLDNSMIQ